MSGKRYAVQLWGVRAYYEEPRWMNIAHRATRKSAEDEVAWLIAHGTKEGNLRIVEI